MKVEKLLGESLLLLLIGTSLQQAACFMSYAPHRQTSVARPKNELFTVRRQTSSSSRESNLEEEIAQMERQVLASAQEKMDYNQITRAILSEEDSSPSSATASSVEGWQVVRAHGCFCLQTPSMGHTLCTRDSLYTGTRIAGTNSVVGHGRSFIFPFFQSLRVTLRICQYISGRQCGSYAGP